jgi:hypothetical protein
VLTERAHREGESEAVTRTIRTAVPRRRRAKREEERARAQEPKKKRREQTDIRDTMLSSTRRATLNSNGSPTTDVRVGKEVAKVSEIGGCARQR